MCICETAFEVTMLAVWCIAYHGITIAGILVVKHTYETADYVMLVYAGAHLGSSLCCCCWVPSAATRDWWASSCVSRRYIIRHDNSKDKSLVHSAMIIPYLLSQLPATKATTMDLFGINFEGAIYMIPVVLGILADAFVIYRVQVFNDTKLGKQQ
ncbi:hypothetical protein MTO96_023003 [Rhipicephalus appendiculatus]